mgnify:CR=1 FL=1
MAIKREKRQVEYSTKIGVNRGSGIASAAQAKAQESQIFDRILTQQADENLKRLQERGERLGLDRATKTKFSTISKDIDIDGTIQTVNVPIMPETPTGMGLTEAKTYQKNIVDLFNARMKTDIDSQILQASREAVMNNATPDIFDRDLDVRLKPFFDAMPDGSYRQLMRTYAQERKDVHSYKVFDNDRRNQTAQAKFNYDNQLANANVAIGFVYKDRKITAADYENVDYESLENAGIDTTTLKLAQKNEIESFNIAGDFFRKHNIISDPNSVNDFNRLIQGKVDEITVNGETITRDKLSPYLSNARSFQIISEELKNLDIYNNEQYVDRAIRQKYENDFSRGIDGIYNGNRISSSIAANPKDFDKFYNKHKLMYDRQLEESLARNGIKINELTKFRAMLNAHSYIPENVRTEIESIIRNPSTTGITTMMPFLETLNTYGIENKEYAMPGMNRKQKRQLGLLISLYNKNGRDAEKTSIEYQSLKDKFDTQGDITQIIQTNIQTGSTYISNRRDLIEQINGHMQKEDGVLKDLRVFSIDRGFQEEVVREVELLLMTGRVITDDDDYVNMISEAVNNVLSYDTIYSIDDTTSPLITSDEILMLKTTPGMQRTRITKYGAKKYYGIVDTNFNTKSEDGSNKINYIHDSILMELEDADPSQFVGEESGKRQFINKMKKLKGTNEFFYEDERETMHIQLTPIGAVYSEQNPPDYFISIYNPQNDSYEPIVSESGTRLIITSEEFNEERDEYIEFLKKGRYE